MKQQNRVFYFVLLFILIPLLSSYGEVISGVVDVHSRRAEMFAIKTEKGVEIVSYSEGTKFLNITDAAEIEREMFIKVEGRRDKVVFLADFITAKPTFHWENITPLTLKQLEQEIAQETPLVDLREKEAYKRRHIPGAIHYSEFIPDNVRRVAFYCYSERCDSGEEIAFLNHIKGANLLFFKDGLKGWVQSKNYLEIGPDELKRRIGMGDPMVILDIRNRDEAAKGFIPGAVLLRQEVVEYSGYRFPAYEDATIIVYGNDDSDERAALAARVIASWRYPNTMVLKGGFKAYRERGFKIARGMINTEIQYERRYESSTIPINKFREYVESLPEGIIIIDVRDEEEFEKGHFPGAVNFPLYQLPFRLDEIDKDKEIITHCVSGIRAKIGYYILLKAGYRVKCLLASVGFEDSGVYSISD